MENSLKERNALLLDTLNPHFERGSGSGLCYVPLGWTDLVFELHNRLVEISPSYIIFQVCSKSGVLRFSVEMDFTIPDGLSDEDAQLVIDGRAEVVDKLEMIIVEYQVRSMNICEVCGSSDATQRGLLRVATLCLACFAKREDEIV